MISITQEIPAMRLKVGNGRREETHGFIKLIIDQGEKDTVYIGVMSDDPRFKVGYVVNKNDFIDAVQNTRFIGNSKEENAKKHGGLR